MGRWATTDIIQTGISDLATATVGLVGLGSTGQAVAARLVAFGTKVVYTSRHQVDPATEEELRVEYQPLPALLASASIVSLHVPLTGESRRLIGEAELAQMRPATLLINTARGGLIDEEALLRSLTDGHLGGAGVDVLEYEMDGHNPFAGRPEVIVTPHIAGASRASTQRIMQLAVANVVRFLGGEEPVDRVPSE
ncbi:MAG: hypothetical protein NVS2B7_26740 [Herpetosiphon sp.]